MSKIEINKYYQNLDRTVQFGKSRNEQSIRNHFWALLNEYARKYNYEVIPEVAVMGTKGKKVYPDGTVKNLWGLDIGLWESKDEKDDIESEIDAKTKKGYPLTNILFEDSNTAVLFQRGVEVNRGRMRDADKLHEILTQFFSYKSETVYKFEEAIEKFKADIPVIVSTLRTRIIESRESNNAFLDAQATFLDLCKAEINPDITLEDVREMMIQHILTSDIFTKIFDDAEFHRHNTIAAALEELIGFLLSYTERRNLLHQIQHYYEAINATAAAITDHHEKQKFLKVLYENFYKVYNPKAADRLGVVYTPNEIVQFMVQSTNYLLYKHFGKTLADKNVEILDPATGTATFVCEIIENAIPKDQLDYKYKNEIHANEVAILPYYIANLNIEYTFKQKMQYYAEFPNLCFVDTLDNIESLSWDRMSKDQGEQIALFGVTSENTERIKRQNRKKISVFIGNPPYNANQKNENENNKNREYPLVDSRIKQTFVKYSSAQKTKAYDMYSRFYRWAMDRIDKNGIIAFITNRSFIDSRTFDGFRKCILDDFSNCYIVDTRSDVRANPKIAGTTHNVFGIQTGVAIMFLVKKDIKAGACQIEYVSMQDEWRKEEKLSWLKNNPIETIHFETIQPSSKNDWINKTLNNDWELNPPLKDDKASIFQNCFLGVSTNRDEWVYDFSIFSLKKKIKYFADIFNNSSWEKDKIDSTNIKWSRDLKNKKIAHKKIFFLDDNFIRVSYRPFVSKFLFCEKTIIDRFTHNHIAIIGPELNQKNNVIVVNHTSAKDFNILAISGICDLHFNGDSFCMPQFQINDANERINNITDDGLKLFIDHYSDNDISQEDLFNYTYAVLHNPAYRKKYELNLKREFPRLPFYKDFHKWASWGKALMDLHINYETVSPYSLTRIDEDINADKMIQKEIFPSVAEPDSILARQPKIKVKLKADKEKGIIQIDELTQLLGIPSIAWDYKLGNRSALEWILDQYKEKKPSDPTIAEKFNTYRFADYKELVINLLMRVCTVSVETMGIIKQMEQEFD